MKSGLLATLKFRRLSRALGSAPLAVGHLELLWQSRYEAASERFADAAEVEDAADWAGEPGALVAHLLRAGFLDACEDGGYVVHDFWDHAPQYVKKRRERRAEENPPPHDMRDYPGDKHGYPPDAACPDADSIPNPTQPSVPNPAEDPRASHSEGEGAGAAPVPPRDGKSGKEDGGALAAWPGLAGAFPRMVRAVERAHPRLRVTARQREQWAQTLGKLAKRHGEAAVLGAFRWVLGPGEERDQVFWREQVQGFGRRLLERKGGEPSKFERILSAWEASQRGGPPGRNGTGSAARVPEIVVDRIQWD